MSTLNGANHVKAHAPPRQPLRLRIRVRAPCRAVVQLRACAPTHLYWTSPAQVPGIRNQEGRESPPTNCSFDKKKSSCTQQMVRGEWLSDKHGRCTLLTRGRRRKVAPNVCWSGRKLQESFITDDLFLFFLFRKAAHSRGVARASDPGCEDT